MGCQGGLFQLYPCRADKASFQKCPHGLQPKRLTWPWLGVMMALRDALPSKTEKAVSGLWCLAHAQRPQLPAAGCIAQLAGSNASSIEAKLRAGSHVDSATSQGSHVMFAHADPPG